MSRLPTLGGDDGVWGTILNDYLSVEHNADGTHRVVANVDATTTSKGSIQLAGDLSGTADAPTVPALANKVDSSDARLSDQRVPTNNSVTNAKVATGAAIALSKLATD